MTKEVKKAPRTNVFSVWKRVILNALSRNRSQMGPIRSYNFYADAQSMYSEKDNVTYVYSIDGYADRVLNSFPTILRRNSDQRVRINFISLLDPERIEWESAKMRAKMSVWRNLDEENRGKENDVYGAYRNLESLDLSNKRHASLWYLTDATVKRHCSTLVNRTLMFLSGQRGVDFDKAVEDIVLNCRERYGLTITRVDRELWEYLSAFSPFKMEYNSKVFKEVGNTMLTDEIVSRFRSYEQGQVGEGSFYCGSDILSRLAVMTNFKERPEMAENIGVIGETGSGKSYITKTLLIQFLADDKFNVTINDIEGDEYIPIANFVANNDKVVILNMAEGEGNYFDPVEITLTGQEEIDRDMFNMSQGFTNSLFQTLVGSKVLNSEKASVWPKKIISQAIEAVYKNAGVTEDPSTWHLSRNLTVHDVYNQILRDYELAASDRVWYDEQRYRNNLEYREQFDVVVAALESYFSPTGIRAGQFQNKVSVRDLKDAKLVLCSFGMKGKSEVMIDEVQIGLTMLYSAMISNIRSNFSKASGKFNVKVFEEFQRYNGLPDAVRIFNTTLTGGRKLGDVTIVVSNKPSELLERDQFGVFENTQSFFIGAVSNSNIRKKLCEVLSIEYLNRDLDSIASASLVDRGGSESIYKQAFLVRLHKVDETIAKIHLPQYLAESPLFFTGVSSKENDVEE